MFERLNTLKSKALALSIVGLGAVASAQPVDPTTLMDFTDTGLSATTIASAILVPALAVVAVWVIFRMVKSGAKSAK